MQPTEPVQRLVDHAQMQTQALLDDAQFWNTVHRWELWVMIIGIPLLLVMCVAIFLILRDIRGILLAAARRLEK
ncbi:MAG: hypothetical protein JWN25_754 [Verrucomicrobiales bacterium]|nr:hypothetical protein [Verrucomicrobiales bacterium]